MTTLARWAKASYAPGCWMVMHARGSALWFIIRSPKRSVAQRYARQEWGKDGYVRQATVVEVLAYEEACGAVVEEP